jgi:uncharacterized protein YuzE
LYNSCPSHDNISDGSTDPSQVLGIECDAPTAKEQTTYQRITSDPPTGTSSNYSIATATYLQTTDSLQSTTKRTKEDTIANDQITGNIIGINVVNRDNIIPCYAKAGNIHETCTIIKGIYLFKHIKSKEKYHKGHYFY